MPPRTHVLVAILLMAAAPLAGCLGDGPDEANEDLPRKYYSEVTPKESNPLESEFVFPDTPESDPATPAYDQGTPAGFNFQVPEEATAMTVTATWTCPDEKTECPIFIQLYDPTSDQVAAEEGTGSVTLRVHDPVPGGWTVTALAEQDPAGVHGEFQVTFEGVAAGEASAD